jgi:hypothetical protein
MNWRAFEHSAGSGLLALQAPFLSVFRDVTVRENKELLCGDSSGVSVTESASNLRPSTNTIFEPNEKATDFVVEISDRTRDQLYDEIMSEGWNEKQNVFPFSRLSI